MNIAMRNVPVVRLVPPVWKITPADWWWWNNASTNAKTTMPRISNSTPVLLMIATSLTPKMLRIVIRMRVTIAKMRWLCRVLCTFQPMLLNAGMRASGRVTQTAVTVRIPANR